MVMREDFHQGKEERTLVSNEPDLIFLNDTIIMTVLLRQKTTNCPILFLIHVYEPLDKGIVCVCVFARAHACVQVYVFIFFSHVCIYI